MIRTAFIKLNDVFPVWMTFLSLFRFFSQTGADRSSISYGACFLMLFAVMAADEIMIRKSIRILRYVGISAVLSIAGGILSLVFLHIQEGVRGAGIMRGFFAVITAGILVFAARHAAEEPRQARSAAMFDFSFVWLLLVVFVTMMMEKSVRSPLILWNGAACLGVLFSLLLYRTGSGTEGGSAGDLKGFVMPGILCALFGALSVFTAGQSRNIAAAVRTVIRLLKRAADLAAAFLTRILLAFAAWLDGLFSPQEYEEMPFDVVIPEIPEEVVSEEAANPVIGWIIIGFFVLLAVWLAVVLLLSLRGRRFSFRRGRRSRFVRRESHLLQELAALLGRMSAALRFEKNYLLHRHSPAGLYVYTRRRLKLRKSRQKKGESPCGFLRRLGTLSGAQSSVYGELAHCLEERLYGNGKSDLPGGFTGSYLKQFKADRAAGRF